ncbi:unnamed protein product [Toxocara canis]|uniref:Retrovirus-related Pol polyprotein from transposon TNT 1-94 n=1 Tax=Toxocara canis TaxID=6265 RepID=A0A183UUN0_TOXCA|nr:unnamed protein product [Toxocara canis]
MTCVRDERFAQQMRECFSLYTEHVDAHQHVPQVSNGLHAPSVAYQDLVVVLISIISDCVLLQANELKLPLYLWSDRQIALSWVLLNNERDRFVRNQVQKIEAVKSVQFRFVPGDMNPVDLSTENLKPEELVDSLQWWQGPPFISKATDNWPEQTGLPTDPNVASSVTTVQSTVCGIQERQHPAQHVFSADRFSNWNSLLRTAATALRLFREISKRNTSAYWMKVSAAGTFSATDIMVAERCLIRDAQKVVGEAEIDSFEMSYSDDVYRDYSLDKSYNLQPHACFDSSRVLYQHFPHSVHKIISALGSVTDYKNVGAISSKAWTLPSPEREGNSLALCIFSTEMKHFEGRNTFLNGTQTSGVDPLRNEGERLLWKAEREIAVAAHKIQEVLDHVRCVAIEGMIIVSIVIELGVGAVLAYRCEIRRRTEEVQVHFRVPGLEDKRTGVQKTTQGHPILQRTAQEVQVEEGEDSKQGIIFSPLRRPIL